MAFREKTVIAILLLVARLLCDDEAMSGEIKSLATRINVAPQEVAA